LRALQRFESDKRSDAAMTPHVFSSLFCRLS
jgi:hypothetical protein